MEIFDDLNTTDYKLLENDMSVDLDGSFLSILRKKRNDNIQKLKDDAETCAKKFLCKPIYDDIKLLGQDVIILMDLIENKSPHCNITKFTITIEDISSLHGIKKLYKIYRDIEKSYCIRDNKILLHKYWIFANNAIEILISALVQKTGISRQMELPTYIPNINIYDPPEGIHFVKNKNYELTVWW